MFSRNIWFRRTETRARSAGCSPHINRNIYTLSLWARLQARGAYAAQNNAAGFAIPPNRRYAENNHGRSGRARMGSLSPSPLARCGSGTLKLATLSLIIRTYNVVYEESSDRISSASHTRTFTYSQKQYTTGEASFLPHHLISEAHTVHISLSSLDT